MGQVEGIFYCFRCFDTRVEYVDSAGTLMCPTSSLWCALQGMVRTGAVHMCCPLFCLLLSECESYSLGGLAGYAGHVMVGCGDTAFMNTVNYKRVLCEKHSVSWFSVG